MSYAGGMPVLNADVQAVIDTPTGSQSQMKLFDNGAGRVFRFSVHYAK